MKAIAVFPATREVKLIDHDEPQIVAPTEVKVRMLEVGVCGTDKEILQLRLRHSARWPRLPHHWT